VDWVILDQNMEKWRAAVYTVSEPSGSIKGSEFLAQLSDY
jgi:hypothetical protein